MAQRDCSAGDRGSHPCQGEGGRNRGKVRTWAAGQTQPEGRVPEIPTPRPERIQKYLDLKIDLHVPDC